MVCFAILQHMRNTTDPNHTAPPGRGRPASSHVTASPPARIQVVPVTGRHWRTYQQVRLRSVRHNGPAFGSPLATLAAKPARYWVDQANTPGRFLALQGQSAVGVIAVDHYTSGPYVCSTWVSPECRGYGVTQLLIEACIEFATAADFQVLHAGVFVANPLARRVFDKSGFTFDGVLRNSGEASGDWIKLTRQLSPAA